MKDKIVLFDWGNIVESNIKGYTLFEAMDKTYKMCGYNKEERVYTYLKKYRLTAINSEKEFKETYEKIKKELNLNKNYEEFKQIYIENHDKIDYFKNVRDYELSLKDRCKIGILSNLNILDKVRIEKQLGLSNYDYVFLTCDIGLRKPDKEIFEYVTKHLPFKKENILLVDDKKENTDAAKAYGWKALTATGEELDKIKEGINSFLEKEDD